MDAIEEMKKWVESLTVSEKRFIKLLGKARSGNVESQQLAYFDWLNQADAEVPVPSTAKFANNLHTVSNRLKDMILDGLRLLNKEVDTDAQLRTTLDEIAILRQKKLLPALARQLRRTKKLSLERSRYGFALQCIRIEQELARASTGNAAAAALETLRKEELTVLQQQCELLELQYRHDRMQVRAAQILVPRSAADFGVLLEIASGEVVERLSETGAYLEQALAVNLLGFVNWMEGKPLMALQRYTRLLAQWNVHPEWQNDQAALLFFICHCYQAICFHSPLRVEEVQHYMALIPDFKGLPDTVALDFQRMLYHNQFTFAFNLGQLDRLPSLMAEIDAWLVRHAIHFTEARILPFLHNFLIAEFIMGHHQKAQRRVQNILQLPHRKVREDIRGFALVMQAILQYEMGDTNLNAYLVRAGKRHFKKASVELAFELAVFRCLEKALGAVSEAHLRKELVVLLQQLDLLAAQLADSTPSLGLFEVRLWAESKLLQKPLEDVFLEAVRENLGKISN